MIHLFIQFIQLSNEAAGRTIQNALNIPKGYNIDLAYLVYSEKSSYHKYYHHCRTIDSRPIPSGCGAVLRGQTWVVFRGRAPSRQHSSFGPTSLSCALSNSVSDCEKGRLADQISPTTDGTRGFFIRIV